MHYWLLMEQISQPQCILALGILAVNCWHTLRLQEAVLVIG
jgi:hypothetical protein